MVAIALGMDFKFSRMIFRDMYDNIKGKRKERFLAFPSHEQERQEDIYWSRPLEKFGRLFARLEEELEDQGSPVAFVAEEHDQVPAAKAAQATETE
ncbi:hypothetical protein R6Q57_018540 [Mikania cordata]